MILFPYTYVRVTHFLKEICVLQIFSYFNATSIKPHCTKPSAVHRCWVQFFPDWAVLFFWNEQKVQKAVTLWPVTSVVAVNARYLPRNPTVSRNRCTECPRESKAGKPNSAPCTRSFCICSVMWLVDFSSGVSERTLVAQVERRFKVD